ISALVAYPNLGILVTCLGHAVSINQHANACGFLSDPSMTPKKDDSGGPIATGVEKVLRIGCHMRKPRLLLADDHAIVLEGLSRWLGRNLRGVARVGIGGAM